MSCSFREPVSCTFLAEDMVCRSVSGVAVAGWEARERHADGADWRSAACARTWSMRGHRGGGGRWMIYCLC